MPQSILRMSNIVYRSMASIRGMFCNHRQNALEDRSITEIQRNGIPAGHSIRPYIHLIGCSLAVVLCGNVVCLEMINRVVIENRL